MSNQDKNKATDHKNAGVPPEDRRYGDRQNPLEANGSQRHQQTDGSSGKADQVRVSQKDTYKEGHDDQDIFDMNSLGGKVGDPDDNKGE